MNETNDIPQKPRYVWPWFVLAALLLGVTLAIVWMSLEVQRTRERREWNPPSAGKTPNAQTEIKPGGTNTMPARSATSN